MTVLSYQALRALAVLFVVFNHLWPNRIPGGYVGVDIFFVISGFLITKHLLSGIRAGRLNFVEFYARRARRLLPAAAATLTATAIGVWLLFPGGQLASILQDVAFAALYSANWRLAFYSVDYFAADASASPVNHFWSLGVEEQFYLVWPCLLLLATSIGGKKLSIARSAGALLIGLGVVSFAAAVVSSAAAPAASYFYTHTRIWEFCIGGLASLISQRSGALSRYLRWALLPAWAVLLACGLLLGPHSGVPGFAALPATLAAAVVMIAGDDHGLRPLGALIRLRPVQWLGDASYSIYLWHWPIIALLPFALPQAGGGSVQALIALALTLVVAALSKHFIEDRFRVSTESRHASAQSTRRGNGLALASCLVLSFGVAGGALAGAQAMIQRSRDVSQSLYAQSLNPGPCFGARATEPGANCPNSHTLADRDYYLESWETQVHDPRGAHNCQNPIGDPVVHPCFYGHAAGTEALHAALIGDSHASAWIPALVHLIDRAQLRLDSYTASSCPPALNADSYARYLQPEYRAACLAWRQSAIEKIASDPTIDLVVVAGHGNGMWRLAPDGGWIEDDGSGFVAAWDRFLAAGKRVLVIDDVPGLHFQLPDCLATAGRKNDPCTRPATEVLGGSNPLSRAAQRMHDPRFSFISFTDVICDALACHSVIGGIPLYIDDTHITAAFARTLAPRLLPYLSPNSRSAASSTG